MLDDANLLTTRDPQNALGFAAKQPAQLGYDFGLSNYDFGRQFENIVFSGMGGSALAADFAQTYPTVTVPFVIRKGYDLPAFVDDKTLVICASYSGNTEETLSCFEQARAKGVTIAVIAHGGKLADLAREYGCPLAVLPEAPQPRTGVLSAYRALCELLVAAKLADRNVLTQLDGLVAPLKQATSQWVASVPEAQNEAKQLAKKLLGKTPIIYAGPLMYSAAYKWKISANENAKNTAWCSALPEFNHNEFIGWSSHPIEKPFAVIDLISNFEHPRIIRRFEVSDRLLSGMRPKAIELHGVGETAIEQLFYLILLGDFTTTYLAILNGVNPTPVDLVEKFKKELG